MFALRHYRGGFREMFAGGRNHRHWTQFLSSKLKDALPHDHIGGPNGAPIMPSLPNVPSVRSPLARAAPASRAGAAYLTKLRYEASASISSGPSVLATRGIGEL